MNNNLVENKIQHKGNHKPTPKPMPHNHQQGVALITVLMIVVLIVVMAAILLAKQNRVLDESAIFLRGTQATNYAQGAETLAAAMLKKDAQTNQTDSKLDIWAQPIPTYAVEDGQVSASIVAADGRFNLNNLYHDGATDEVQLRYFQRLLTNLGLDPLLAEAVIDWQDPDDTPYGNTGAEREFYQGLKGTMLPTNQPFVRVQELAWVHGFDAEKYALLAPHVTALPNFSKINVNVAEASVLAALTQGINLKDATEFTNSRTTQEAIDNIANFVSLPAFNTLDSNPDATNLKAALAVTSSYFTSYAKVTLDGRSRYLTSSLLRQGNDVTTYARDDSAFTLNTLPKPNTPTP